jgi:cobalt-zinc-cadmium efflux system outer membrane protein
VRPAADFREAGRLAAERTGAAEVYDPATEALVEEKIAARVSGGLTLDEAVGIALLNHRELQSLFARIGASRADVVQSSLVSNPSLSLMLRFPEGGGRSNLTLGFAQQLVDLWQIPVRRRIAEAQLRQTVLQVAHRAVELAAETQTRCHQLSALTRAVGMTEEGVKLAERSLQLARSRYEAGEAGLVDVNLVRAGLLEVQTALIGLRRDRENARYRLGRVMGLSRRPVNWELVDSLPSEAAAIAPDAALVWTAMEDRLDARAAAMEVQAAEEELRRQYLAIVPSVELGAEWERLERRKLGGRKVLADTARSSVAAGAPTAPQIESRGQRDLDRSRIIDSLLGPTLTLTLPVWDQNQAQIARSRFTLLEKRKGYEDLLDSVALQVQEAARAARAAAELVRFYEESSLPQARQNITVAMKAYEAGEQSILAVLDAQRFLIAQRLAAVNVRRDLAVALVELRRAVGGRLPAAATSQPATTQPS